MTHQPELHDAVPNERLTAIYGRAVEKLKEVVREFAITQDELHVAGDFFNRLGQSGFWRSLVDVNLAMTSVDVTARDPNGTRPNLEGPFYRHEAPLRPNGDMFDHEPGTGAPILTLSGTVRDSNTGAPLPGTELHIWQADHEGHYDLHGLGLFGKVIVDAEGRYRLRTVVPKDYSDHDHDPIGELYRAMGRHNRRSAHIHLKIVRDGECLLTTQLFIPGNPYLSSDYVEGAVSDDLVLDLRPVDGTPDAYEAVFDIRVAAPA